MAGFGSVPPEQNDCEKFSSLAPRRNQEPQEEWISGEELYTEGSSDEDDMALRMKRRERREAKKEKPSHVSQVLSSEDSEVKTSDKHLKCIFTSDQQKDENSYNWRPTQGRLVTPLIGSGLKHAEECTGADSGNASQDVELTEEAETDTTSSTSSSLSEAYSNMHRLDALLRDSERRLKEAQAETLRAQLATRAKLQELRDRSAGPGGSSVLLARNWDAFMQLCPVSPTGPWSHSEPPRAGAARALGGAGGLEGGDGDPGCSILPRISGAISDVGSDSSDSADSALAITDEEKLKLAALLHDLDQERDAHAAGVGGYNLDGDARRSLDQINDKLQELVPEGTEAPSTSSLVQGLAKGTTRLQRLEDIDRCLQALADSALEDVEPMGEDEVRALLEKADGAAGDLGVAEGEAGVLDASFINELIAEARQELPRFRYRHHGHQGHQGAQSQPRTQPRTVGQ